MRYEFDPQGRSETYLADWERKIEIERLRREARLGRRLSRRVLHTPATLGSVGWRIARAFARVTTARHESPVVIDDSFRATPASVKASD